MLTLAQRLSLSCLAVLLFASGAPAQEHDIGRLAATYLIGHEFGGSSLKLDADGRYSEESGDCTTAYSESGTYVLSGGAVHFTILDYTARGHGSAEEANLLDPEERKKVFGDSSGEVRREYKLLPVAWSGRLYLIPESELKNFVNAVNLGLEPRTQSSPRLYYGTFYLRRGDEQKAVSGPPSLPEAWLPLLLRRPVTAEVVAVETNEAEQVFATINRGSRQGLKVGMRLLAEGEEPSPWRGAEVVSVGETTARLQVWGELKVGDQLATKYERKEAYR